MNRIALRFTTCLALFFFLISAPLTFAQDEPQHDAEGCKDSPLITRMAGSIIHSCNHKEYDQAVFNSGKDKDGNDISKTVEGDYNNWDYTTRSGTSEIQVSRNIENALKAAGFHIDSENSPEDLTAHKGNTWYLLSNRGEYYDQTIVTAQDMKQEVTADASSLSDEINKSGRVAVYGIHFDTNKATIQPDSEDTLNQIVKLMQDNADWKLRIEGYTDNAGNASANQVLSEKRAQAVVAWLSAHGVDKSRLAAQGLGQKNPVADNSTDDGRAKNRRVELVKI